MRCRHGQLVTVREENGGGAERCVWLLASLIAGAHMALVVYDITDLVITLRPHLHRTANHQLPNNETDMRVHACKHTTHRHERTCTQLLPLARHASASIPSEPGPARPSHMHPQGSEHSALCASYNLCVSYKLQCNPEYNRQHTPGV